MCRLPLELVTPEIHLVPYALADAGALHEAGCESWREVHPWMPWCHEAYALREAEEWLAGQVPKFAAGLEYDFTIRDDSGTYLGACGLNDIDADNQRCNLGYWVRTSAAGRGIASTATRRLSAWAFENTTLVRLEIVAALGNLASQRVAEKAGAIREGTLQKRMALHGVWHDAALYAITRPGVATPY